MKHKVIKYVKKVARGKGMEKPTGQDIVKYVNDKWTNPICPMCGSRSWNVTDKIFELREFNDGNIVLGGPNSALLPVIPVTCENCGNTIFINALASGLIKE